MNLSSKNKYLGSRVKDTKEKGFDSRREISDTLDLVIKDFKKGKITRKTANGRFWRMRQIIRRSNNFSGEKEEKAIKLLERKQSSFKKRKNNHV